MLTSFSTVMQCNFSQMQRLSKDLSLRQHTNQAPNPIINYKQIHYPIIKQLGLLVHVNNLVVSRMLNLCHYSIRANNILASFDLLDLKCPKILLAIRTMKSNGEHIKIWAQLQNILRSLTGGLYQKPSIPAVYFPMTFRIVVRSSKGWMTMNVKVSKVVITLKDSNISFNSISPMEPKDFHVHPC